MEENITMVSVKDIKSLDNSRIGKTEVSELMKSIKQIGVLQPIILRGSDNSIVMGNRRFEACKKLGWTEVPCVLKGNLSDDAEIYIMNLTENIQRKDISPIEIGRYCSMLNKGEVGKTKYSIAEISVKLGIAKSRITRCIFNFNRTPDKIKNKIRNGRGEMNIPETVVRAINLISKNCKQLTEKEYIKICDMAENDDLQPSHINMIGILMMGGRPLDDALKILNDYRLSSIVLIFNKKSLGKALEKYKCKSSQDLIRKILTKEDENLIL